MKPCAKPFCPELVERDQRFCKEHGGNSNWAAAQARRTDAQNKRTTTAKWKKFRQRILKRDGYLCQECKRNGRLVSGREVDHIVPLSQGGEEYDGGNVELLCSPCHRTKTAAEGRGVRG